MRKLKGISLVSKLQVMILAYLLVTFGVITWQAVENVEDEYLKYNEGRLLRKSNTIIRYIKYKIHDQVDHNIEVNWSTEVNRISKINNIDLMLYDTKGNQLGASLNNDLHKSLYDDFIENASLIDHKVYSNQVDGNKYLSYLSLIPHDQLDLIVQVQYKDNARDESEEIKSLLLRLVETYLIFLVIILIIFPFLMNKMLKPLSLVRSKMNNLKLGIANEKIHLDSHDELGKLVGEYNKMIDQLAESAQLLKDQERESAWKEIAQQVAHEIKNPLTPMKLSIQHLLRARGDDPEKYDKLVTRVSNTLIEQIDHLAYIASEFSSFARIPEPKLENLDIQEEIQKVVTLYEGNEDVSIELKLNNEDLKASLDSNQFNRILNNLIKNASQAKADERACEIQLMTYENEGFVHIEVKDNGTGIPEDIKDKIFVPNFSTKSSGMGIGLAMCKRMIENVEGDIYFESEEDMGTTFFIKIPLIKVQE